MKSGSKRERHTKPLLLVFQTQKFVFAVPRKEGLSMIYYCENPFVFSLFNLGLYCLLKEILSPRYTVSIFYI